MKNKVEEAAMEYCQKNIPNLEQMHLTISTAFESGADWQSKQLPWISVKEQLPEESGYYFVTDGCAAGKAYFLKKWNKFAKIEEYPHLFYDEGVIKAYMPIPSFDEILEANRDVLERIKEKGD